MIQFIWFTFVLFNFSSSTKYQFFSSSCFCNYCWFQMRILNMYYLVFKLFHKNYIALMALSISISFHFRRTPRNWTGNLYERQEHSGAVWANSQLLFWFDCLYNKNIKTLKICPHCLAVSLSLSEFVVFVENRTKLKSLKPNMHLVILLEIRTIGGII